MLNDKLKDKNYFLLFFRLLGSLAKQLRTATASLLMSVHPFMNLTSWNSAVLSGQPFTKLIACNSF